jgi:hypothetical protein
MTGNNRTSKKGRRGFIVQPRDRNLLRALEVLRVADCAQLMIVAGFGSITRANTRLLQLVRAGLLRRFFLGSGGGRRALYALSRKGAELVGVIDHGPRRRQNEVLVADYFIAHQLAVNDLYCTLKYKAIPTSGVRFHRWLTFSQQFTPTLGLIPDGYIEFMTPAGIAGCFVEVDLGHESLSVWKQKANNYLQLALSGDYQELFGQERFRVLVLVNSERRLHSIRKAVSLVTEKIAWFATLESSDSNFFGTVGLRPNNHQPKPLFEELP